jgi:hypothetical protein
MKAQPSRVPNGLAIFLKVARVLESAPDTVTLELPPGPGLERLVAEPATRRTLESLLAEQLGRTVRVEVRPVGGAASTEQETPQRFTADAVKKERLAHLAAQEPTLKKAVEEWNLELLD